MYLGIDIGGSHITAAQVNVKHGLVIEQSLRRTKLDPHASDEEILTCWADTIIAVAGGQADYLVGIAMPGPFDYQNGICLMKNVNKYDSLFGMNIRDELAKRLQLSPNNIIFRNDSEAFLDGEMAFGAGKSFHKGIGITLGTGLGTSVYHDGKSFDMGLGINQPLHSGVAEDYISTRWFVNRFQELTQTNILGVKQVAELYHTDKIARQIFEEFSQNITLFVHLFVEKFQPEVIIFGGNIAQSSELFFPAIEAGLKHVLPPIVIRKSVLNENAALMGAVSFGTSMLTK